MKNNGVKEDELLVTEDAVRDIVRYYTREAGVRSLERELSKICRKVVKGLQLKKMTPQGRRQRRRTSTTSWACASTPTAAPRSRTRSARWSAWRGPKSAATC